MIRQSMDGSGTPFSHWLRKQNYYLPSCNAPECFTFVNVDYVLRCYKGPLAGKWMFIEEKRHQSTIKTRAQEETFKTIEKNGCLDPDFCGFHLIQFENTSPEDGRVYVDGQEIDIETLLSFLRFELPRDLYYHNYYDESKTEAMEIIKTHCKRIASMLQNPGVSA